MRITGWTIIGVAVSAASFVGAFGATYAYERRGSRADEGLLLISLSSVGGLPSAAITEVGSDGSSPRPLTAAPSGVASAADFQPAWSEAAGLFVFARETFTSDGTGTAPKLYAQRDDGSEPRRLTAGLEVDRYPDWSSDGRRIVFARDVDGAFELFVIDADGTNLRQLTRDNRRYEDFPSWSPDGTRIAFSSTAGEDGDLRVMNADGSGVTSLTEGPENDVAPAWSPDGSSLAFIRDGSLFVMASDGSNVRRLTTDSGRYTDPSWSPEGSRIALVEEESGRLFVIGADGTGLEQVPVAGTVLSGVSWRTG